MVGSASMATAPRWKVGVVVICWLVELTCSWTCVVAMLTSPASYEKPEQCKLILTTSGKEARASKLSA